MDVPFTLDGIFRRRGQVKLKESLQAALTHAAVAYEVFIHLPFHHPFVKPNELIGFFYSVICENKIVITSSATIALLAILLAPFLHPSPRAYRVCQSLFSSKKYSPLKRLSIGYPKTRYHKESYPILPTISDQYVFLVRM